MFVRISTAIDGTTRSSERNVSGDDCASSNRFAPTERGEPFAVARSIQHFVPTGRGSADKSR